MLGGSFQGSNDGINFTTIFTIDQTPAYDWNSTSVNTNCRYIRYVSPTNGYCNVAELEFWGSSTIFSATGVTVSPAAVSISIGNTLQLTPTVLPTYTTNQLVSWSSSNPSIASVNSTGIVTANATSSATITVTTQDGNKTATCIVNSTSFFTDSKLSGILFDNITPYGGGDTDGNRAFDGNTATYVDANTISGGYTGIDFGSVLTVTTIKYYPRANFASRMIGGTFQGSNDGINFTTVFTIAQTPAYDWNVTTVNANCRYLRYLSPANGYCNVAELEFWGRSVAIPTTGVSINPTSASIIVGATQQLTASVLPANATNQAVSWSSSNSSIASVNSTGLVTANAPGSATITVTTQDGSRTATCTFTCTSVCIDSKLMGTQFDNITPYGGADADGNRAFDGNTATYVDADANTGGYTGIDFGSSRTVSTIKFFPRANFESRMTGGIFQGSTDGSIYTDVYTISGNPTNAWTSVTVNVSYRYMRYLGPTNGYCNVAEIEFWGGCSLRSNSPQVLNLATSVNPASVSETIDMFPNPIKVGGILHFNGCKDATINIFNIDGKLMFNAKLTNNSLALPVSIKSGLYLVSINANHHVLKGKLNVK